MAQWRGTVFSVGLLSCDCRRMALQHFAFAFQICRTSPSATENTCVSRAPAHIFCGNITRANGRINLHIEWSLVKQTVFPIHVNNAMSQGKCTNEKRRWLIRVKEPIYGKEADYLADMLHTHMGKS